MTSKKPKPEIFFTPFILSSLRIDMNNNYSRTPTPTFLQENSSNVNNNNELYNYIIYIYNNEEREKAGVGRLQEKER